jgi:mono/diheme cytochrome c family protein
LGPVGNKQGSYKAMKKFTLTILVLMLAMLLVACGGSDDSAETVADAPPASVGDAAAGEALYAQTIIGTTAGCATCHSLEAGVQIVGPSHAGVATRAGEYVAGESAEQYLRTSILEPNAHLVEGFTEGVMPQTYKDELSNTQVDDLVAYLLTLK